MTCHNRREKTLASLAALFQQVITPEFSLQVYLVDDGSSDDTATVVQANYSEAILLKGDGSLFWNGGMRLAYSEAVAANYDYYLWLNDDTLLAPNALENLYQTHAHLSAQGKLNSILVGSTQDEVTGELTYGGVVRPSRWRRLYFQPLEPSDRPQECETMNGNCVLIPHLVAEKVGILDCVFTHGMGDFDYGLKARKLGCSVWIAPGYIGTCSKNPAQRNRKETNSSLLEQLKQANQTKGLPIQEWQVFARRYAGSFWYLYWLSPYLRLIINYLLVQKLKIYPKRSGNALTHSNQTGL